MTDLYVYAKVAYGDNIEAKIFKEGLFFKKSYESRLVLRLKLNSHNRLS